MKTVDKNEKVEIRMSYAEAEMLLLEISFVDIDPLKSSIFGIRSVQKLERLFSLLDEYINS